jgi:hypothetical protein
MPVIGKQKIVREPGYMYYVKDGYVWASPLKGNVNGKKHQVNNEHLPHSIGKMCWVNKQGYAETK